MAIWTHNDMRAVALKLEATENRQVWSHDLARIIREVLKDRAPIDGHSNDRPKGKKRPPR